MLLGGIGEIDAKRTSNYFVVTSDTPVEVVEERFKHYRDRTDIAIILISQQVRNCNVDQSCKSFHCLSLF